MYLLKVGISPSSPVVDTFLLQVITSALTDSRVITTYNYVYDVNGIM
jgi:hypothetical protein